MNAPLYDWMTARLSSAFDAEYVRIMPETGLGLQPFQG